MELLLIHEGKKATFLECLATPERSHLLAFSILFQPSTSHDEGHACRVRTNVSLNGASQAERRA